MTVWRSALEGDERGTDMQGLVQLVEGPVNAGLKLEELIRADVVLGEPLSVSSLEQCQGSIGGGG